MKKIPGIQWTMVTVGVAMLLVLAVGCTETVEVPGETVVIEKEVVKEVMVPGETVVKEVVKTVEVPGETVVVREEVVKTVEVPGETVVVEKEVVKEVVKTVEVPGETVVKEVVKTVEVPVEKLVVERVEVVKDIGWTPRAPEPNPKYGGIIRLSAPHRMAHFDFHQGAAAYAGQTNIYNNLVYYNQADGLKTIGPDLAMSWDVSDGGNTYTFKLREGVKWHDGMDFSADDVVATFNRIISPPEGLAITATGLFESVESVEAIDPLTVRFNLKTPTPWFIELLASDNYSNPAVIYPKHFMEANNFDLREKVAPGTGPFMLNEIKQDEYWDLDANPDYFVPHLPYADGARLLNVIPFCDRGTAVPHGPGRFHLEHLRRRHQDCFGASGP